MHVTTKGMLMLWKNSNLSVGYMSVNSSLLYPNGYYAKEDRAANSNFHTLLIGKDSLDEDKTTIMWEMPNTFPGTVKEFITFLVSKEIEDYEKSNTFYDVMLVDSTYTIDGYPTYSITSI